MWGSLNWLLDAGYQFHRAYAPPVHEMSMLMYSSLFLPVLFFSMLFYVLAFSGIMTPGTTLSHKPVRKWPFVSVHIPTLNETVAIRCAKKCLGLDYPKSKLEIIIGDDSNDPSVSRKIAEFASHHKNIKYIKRESNEGFKAGNLNNMLRHSRGEIIVNFDSDFLPPSDFLKKAIPPFVEDDKVGFVQAKWDYINIDQNIVTRFAASVLMVYQNLLAFVNKRFGVPLLFGSGLAVRKELLTRTGGWLEGSVTEDVEFSIRAIKEGYKSVYITDLVVPGEVPFTVRGFFKQQKRWAYGNAKTFMDYKKWILLGSDLNIFQRFSITATLLGYIASPFLILFMFFGTLSFMTGDPAAIDISKFLTTTGWTVAMNSGFIVATVIALFREKRLRMMLHVLLGAFTVGLYTAFGVTSGFLKAVTGRPIEWYMIRKAGNESGPHAVRSSAVS